MKSLVKFLRRVAWRAYKIAVVLVFSAPINDRREREWTELIVDDRYSPKMTAREGN